MTTWNETVRARVARVGASCVLVAFALVAAAGDARACGGFFCDGTVVQPPIQNGERIVFVQDGTTTTAIIQILYQGDPADFSWVVPVAAEPTLDVEDPRLFDMLDGATAPRFQFITGTRTTTFGTASGSCTSDAAGAAPDVAFAADAGVMGSDAVTIVGTEAIGPFETTILTSDDPMALRDWLVDNEYSVPDDSLPLVSHYVERDHYWVALKLRADVGVGALQPLTITYEGESCIPVLLTAIASTPRLDVTAWFIADAPVRPMNYATLDFDWQAVRPTGGFTDYRALAQQSVDEVGGHGFVTELAMPTADVTGFFPGVGVEELLARGTWITRLYTSLRQEDMTLDPTFAPDDAVLPQDNNHVIDLRATESVGSAGGAASGDGCAVGPAAPRVLAVLIPVGLALALLGVRRRRP